MLPMVVLFLGALANIETVFSSRLIPGQIAKLNYSLNMEWLSFKQRHQKVYADADEEFAR